MTATKKQRLDRPDPAEALAKLEQPGIKWKVVLQIVVAFAVLWVVGFMVVPWIGYWGVGVVGVLTAVAIGFGVYIYRMTRRSAAIVDILKGATDEEGRKAALKRLEAEGSGDAIAALARAQLVARESPAEAMAILESIDLKKAPAVVQDDVRANLGLLYLVQNRVREAKDLAAEIRLDRQPQAQAKAMYAAVLAETHARSGNAAEAKKLLETYKPTDPEYADVRALLLRAQVFTFVASKNRGLARKAMEQLATVDPNMLAAFLQKGTPPEVSQFARQLLTQGGFAPKPRVRRVMR